MKTSKHAARTVTPAGRSVFRDLFPPAEAAELEIRATLLRGLQEWLAASGKSQAAMARQLEVTQARVSDIKRGKTTRSALTCW
ncbi:MAG: XRE family transcriptional regulator [Gammaproteobacteria bacterium]|nr:XRE family transcriptional regulator [Gammaproteobacteria bacterium]